MASQANGGPFPAVAGLNDPAIVLCGIRRPVMLFLDLHEGVDDDAKCGEVGECLEIICRSARPSLEPYPARIRASFRQFLSSLLTTRRGQTLPKWPCNRK
jgi:hypothetical protein